MNTKNLIISVALLLGYSCNQTLKRGGEFNGEDGEVRIIQINPTHSHAASVQSEPLSQIDTNVYVYSPDIAEVEGYLQQIQSFNSRKNNPTKWNEVVYSGKDYLEKMAREKKGNVVVLAGNNRFKIGYIEYSINAGLNVFSDKPMVINKEGFERLKNAYTMAEEKGLLMFDMMTERYSPINAIQRSLMMDTALFGKMEKGTPENPAIMESSVHHFYRGGKGNRPYWFFDVSQQGEGIVDITTHLIDLVFWKSFPDEAIYYDKDVKVLSAEHSPVNISRTGFMKATSLSKIPESLSRYMSDSTLKVFANGSINYQIKDVHAEVKVEWRFAPPTDGGDLRNAYARGTKCTLFIRQEHGQTPQLHVENGANLPPDIFEKNLKAAITALQKIYPGISISKESGYTAIVIPSHLERRYDPTFKIFLGYLVNRNMPEWEIPNTISKYYITTKSLEMVNQE